MKRLEHSTSPRRGLTLVLAVVVLALPLLTACATQRPRPRIAEQAPLAFADPPQRAGAPTLLIAMPPSASFLAARKSLVSEVQKSFNVQTLSIRPETTVGDLASAIGSAHPACIVLMNNATMSLYRQYQEANPQAPTVPAVLLMAAFVEEVRAQLRRATGIAYEVPGVTAFVRLRAIVATPVNRIGVIYRPAFHRLVEYQKSLAAKEHFELVSLSVAHTADAEDVRAALHRLATEERVDAIWMLNDNGLVRDAGFVEAAWRSELRAAKLPLIVGVPNLIEPSWAFGTLAVIPDHEALGLQAANLLFDLADAGWQADSHPVEQPLSVKTHVDVKLARDSFGLRPDAFGHIDLALE